MTSPDDAPGHAVTEDGAWRRVHWITPLLRGWQGLAVVLVVVVSQFPEADWARELAGEGVKHASLVGVLVAIGVLLLIALLAVGWLVLAWNLTRFRITPEALELYRGVLFKQHRTARLDRLQAVNISQPFLARIVGLSRLKLEVAGGGDAGIALEFLREEEATSLRNHLLARAAGLDYETVEAPVAPVSRLASLPTDRLVKSVIFSPALVVFIGLAVATVVIGLVSRSFAAVFFLVPGLFAVGGGLWTSFTRGFDFTVDTADDGLHVQFGLLEKQSLTIAPGRIQAVGVSQPLIWRPFGWWRIRVNVAGSLQSGDEDVQTVGVVHPVATLEEVRTLLPFVVPFLAADDGGADLLREGLIGQGEGAGYVTSPRRARIFDPWQWQRTGFASTGSAVLIRHGRVHRGFIVVPHERTQSLGLTQGPLLRRRQLATVGVHSTLGPVRPSVPRLDALVAQQLVMDQTERARRARENARPERWMEQYAAVLRGHRGSDARPASALGSELLQEPAEPAQPAGVEEFPPAR